MWVLSSFSSSSTSKSLGVPTTLLGSCAIDDICRGQMTLRGVVLYLLSIVLPLGRRLIYVRLDIWARNDLRSSQTSSLNHLPPCGWCIRNSLCWPSFLETTNDNYSYIYALVDASFQDHLFKPQFALGKTVSNTRKDFLSSAITHI